MVLRRLSFDLPIRRRRRWRRGEGPVDHRVRSRRKIYTFYFISSTGTAIFMRGTVDGRVWTWSGELRVGAELMKARTTITDQSPTSYGGNLSEVGTDTLAGCRSRCAADHGGRRSVCARCTSLLAGGAPPPPQTRSGRSPREQLEQDVTKKLSEQSLNLARAYRSLGSAAASVTPSTWPT